MAMRLIVRVPGATAPRQPNPRLIKLLAQGQAWFRLLAGGSVASAEELARQEKCTGSYVTRVAQLAFLAPDLVEAIALGEQPPELTATGLISKVPLPLDWAEQRRVLMAAS
jgi:hypothetical protein